MIGLFFEIIRGRRKVDCEFLFSASMKNSLFPSGREVKAKPLFLAKKISRSLTSSRGCIIIRHAREACPREIGERVSGLF